jgi:hypothetical protein
MMGQVLVLLACCTSFDVFCDPCLGARPEVFPVDVSDCFISSGVAIDGAFMPHIHEFTFQPLIQGYDKTSHRPLMSLQNGSSGLSMRSIGKRPVHSSINAWLWFWMVVIMCSIDPSELGPASLMNAASGIMVIC